MNHFAVNLKHNIVNQLYFNLKITKKRIQRAKSPPGAQNRVQKHGE